MIKTYGKWVVMSFALLLPSTLLADVIPFEDERWTFRGEITEFQSYKGKKAIYLHNAGAYLEGLEFEKGILEYDVLFQDNRRGFSGIRWHIQENPGDFENFYIRPHNGGQDDANQYQPSFNGSVTWQIFYGPQWSAPTVYKYDEWMHVKIIVGDDKAEIYIDSDEPVIFVKDLLGDYIKGGLGYSTGLAPTYLANFSVTHDDNPTFKGTPLPDAELPKNIINSWALSESFSHNNENLPSAIKSSWKRGQMESNGVLNISKYRTWSQDTNTAFAKLIIKSDKAQTKKLSFGYSDFATVYLEDQPLYSGSNLYRSRDYRYLGTLGVFDEVYLPLKAGDNEVFVKVTDSFGGWAVMGYFEDMSGITIE